MLTVTQGIVERCNNVDCSTKMDVLIFDEITHNTYQLQNVYTIDSEVFAILLPFVLHAGPEELLQYFEVATLSAASDNAMHATHQVQHSLHTFQTIIANYGSILAQSTNNLVKFPTPLGRGAQGTVWSVGLRENEPFSLKVYSDGNQDLYNYILHISDKVASCMHSEESLSVSLNQLNNPSSEFGYFVTFFTDFLRVLGWVEPSANRSVALPALPQSYSILPTKRVNDQLFVAKLEIITQFLTDLSCIHSKGIVHRDIKPENVVVGVRQDDHTDIRVLIIDLDINCLRFLKY